MHINEWQSRLGNGKPFDAAYITL